MTHGWPPQFELLKISPTFLIFLASPLDETVNYHMICNSTFTSIIWLDYAEASVISKGEQVTLMDWGNAIIKEIKTENGTIRELVGELHLEGSAKMTKLKLTWLPDIEELVPLSLVEFDYLIKNKKLDKVEEDLSDKLNPCTRRETAVRGDPNMRNLKHGEIIQLERKGYFRCDVPFELPSKPIVLFAIPDGRQQSMLN